MSADLTAFKTCGFAKLGTHDTVFINVIQMIKFRKGLILFVFAILSQSPVWAQNAKKVPDPNWESDIRTFGMLATMSYQNGRQVLGKYSPELEKKIARAKITNARMEAILPTIGTIARDIDFQERVYIGVANRKPLTPDETAVRTKSLVNAFAAGLGDEDAKDQVIGDIVEQYVQQSENQRGAEQAIYQLRAQKVKLWEQLIADLRSQSGVTVSEPCIKLEHPMTFGGIPNVVQEQSMVGRNISGKDLHNFVLRMNTFISSSPHGTDEKFFFIPVFTRGTRIELSGNIYGQLRPVPNMHLQDMMPRQSQPAAGSDTVMISIPAGTHAFTLSIWSNELQREDVDLELQEKPKIDTKQIHVPSGPLPSRNDDNTLHSREGSNSNILPETAHEKAIQVITPHSIFLFFIFIFAIGSLIFYRLRPRVFMKTMRWINDRSGFAIVLLGLTVLVCGCIGFATVSQDSSETTYDFTVLQPSSSPPVNSPGQSKPPSPPLLESQNGTLRLRDRITTPTERTSLAGAIYKTFQIFAFNIDHTELERSILLQVAMFSAILLATIVASKGIALLFRESYEKLGLRFKSMHVVVCGLGRIGRQILADLEAMKSEFQIVVIEPDGDNKNIEWAREMGAVVIIGDATRTEILEAARVQRAREVFVVTGSDECNIESVIEIRDIIARKGRKGRFGGVLPKLSCHVHILCKDLAEIVRDKSLQLERDSRDDRNTPGRPVQEKELIDVEVFNALERTARRLLEDISAKVMASAPVAATNSNQDVVASPRVVHFFMFGFGEFGQTLALKLAELSHFPSCSRSRMTVIDVDIEKKSKAFTARYPAFCAEIPTDEAWQFATEADVWDSKHYRPSKESRLNDDSPGIEYVCNARFVEYLDIADDALFCSMKAACESKHVQPIILVCFEDDRENFARAERLRAKLNSSGCDWPIFVWIPRQRELSQLLSEHRHHTSSQNSPPCHLIPFGQCYGSVSYAELNDSWMDWLARHIHLIWMGDGDEHWTANVQKLQAALQTPDAIPELADIDWKDLDKTAKLVWETRSEWERASNRSCAVHAVLKAAALGLRITGYTTKPTDSLKDIKIKPELDEQLRSMEHYRWVAERLLAGWRYHEERSDIRKTRWQITSWSGLDSPPQSYIKEKRDKGQTVNEKNKDQVIVRLLIGLVQMGLLTTYPHDKKR